MSLALARKYRPSTFDDLIGQESISQTLSLALETDRLSHAYLFSGLRGSGKTSTARIFAKALICEKGVTPHPCGICSHCMMAIENRHLDIIEMDAASNRGIDDIKELIEHTKYQPSSARYKIFIIDEVHMLTPQAFNALLKTLEEPPSFVKFILATTDPLKLPATILSRTQHFRFRRIPQHLILKHLEHILNLEKIDYESDAINIIARSGAGSLRDALTLTDQAIVYAKNFIDTTTVTEMLGIIETSHLDALLIAILNKDTLKILEFIKQATNYEAEMILDELTLCIKDKLLSSDTLFSPMIIEKFFIVIAESKQLLALGSDSEFILALSFFKMMESLTEKKEITPLKIDVPPLQHKEPSIPKIEKKIITPQPPVITVEDTFNILIKKIQENNEILGEVFIRTISFESYANNQLKWHSNAQDEDKKILINHWGLINMFVKDVFGLDTKIINISKKHPIKTQPIIENHPQTISPSLIEEPLTLNIPQQQEEEMKSSCIAPDAGDTESAKEKDPSTLLEEPMIKEAIALFDPKKVRIKRNA